MTTKIKQEIAGPKLTKKQRAEALEFWTELSAPKAEAPQAKTNTLEQCALVIEYAALSNEDIDKLMAQLKALRTTSHKSGPTTGVGSRCKELIKSGLGNKEVLIKIKEEFPMNNTTYSCVAWYRNDMKQKGEL
jgi:hypothetical protein